MARILIRCDASLNWKRPHHALPDPCSLLKEAGLRSRFSAEQPGDLINLIEQEFSVLALPGIPTTCHGLEGRELYHAWLGCSREGCS